MLVKKESKVNTKLILQHPIRYPQSSHNAIVDTGATKYFVITNTPLIKKRKQLYTLLFNYQMAQYQKQHTKVIYNLQHFQRKQPKLIYYHTSHLVHQFW